MADFGINWGMGVAPDAGGAFTQGFQNGQAMRRENDTRNALASFAQNPNMQSANALIAVDPRLGMQARQQQMEIEKQAHQQQAIAAATQGGGEHQSVGALVQMGVPYEMARQINNDHIAQIGKTADFLGQVGLQISTAPEEQRPQLWNGALQQAQALGIEVPPEFQQYSPQALSGVLAASKQVKEAIGLAKPQILSNPAGAGVVSIDPITHAAKFIIEPNDGTKPIGAAVTSGNTAPASGPGSQPGGMAPPPAAVEHLRGNPSLAAAFDQKYGQGASAQYLQGGASPSGSANFPAAP